jgi:hypothetical protein
MLTSWLYTSMGQKDEETETGEEKEREAGRREA